MTAVPLKSLCQIRHGGTPSKANVAYWVGHIPWVSPKDMKSAILSDACDHISQEAVENSATSVVPEKSILVVVRSGILAHSLPVAQVAKPLAFNQDIKALTPDDTKVDPDYLFWFIRAKEPQVLAQGVKKGATVHSLQSGFIENLQVPLPAREEQRRIVDLLSRAEGIVRLRREAEKKAVELIPALFLDMFGDPGRNPKEWPVQRLGDIAAVVSGVTKGRKFGDKPTVEVPYLRVANVQAGHVDLSVVKTIEVLPQDVQQLALQSGDVVLTEGGDFDKLGRGALWEHDIPNCIHQNHVFRVRLNKSIALPEFFVTYLQAGKAREYFIRCAKRTTNLASINMTQLRDLPVVLPAQRKQQRFVDHFRDARSIQAQQSTATAKAKATFDALLAQAFSG